MRPLTGDLDTDRGPPLAIPLQHLLVGLVVLVIGGLLEATSHFDAVGLSEFAWRHLYLVGWIGVTIMGAMTQFVPVWSGVSLYSRRLASLQLWLVVLGVLGFAGAFLGAQLVWLHVAAVPLVVGVWLFAYNIARTLWNARPLDVTEWHFAFALFTLVLVTGLGYLIALDYLTPLFFGLAISRTRVAAGHATLAVFGTLVGTVIGALYQLVPMFAQVDDDAVDALVQRVEIVAFPAGVIVLATGRLFGGPWLARLGGILLVGSVTLVGILVLRMLVRSATGLTPVLGRYLVVGASMMAWAVLTVPTWLATPLARSSVLGSPVSEPILLLGVLGFVVFGTLYHVVPFLLWIRTYSDRIGYEPVPMVDDLYDASLARLDFVVIAAGTLLRVGGRAMAGGSIVERIASVLLVFGFLLVAANVGRTVHRHGPRAVRALLVPGVASESTAGERAEG